MQEIGKLNQKINVIPNYMEKYMTFIKGKNLVFIDTMQFMNSRLEKLVKNLPEDKFKYFSQKFCGKKLK